MGTEAIVIIVILSVLLIVALIGIRNLLKQNEELEDMYTDYMNGMLKLSQRSLEKMREVDANGAFESDDEVGVIFNDLKGIVEHLNERVGNSAGETEEA